ncbi:DUF6292 family protein [Amycolatopsis sp. NPDC059235]|uniref:DUF6292 family protein n=1 Tax=Amycolatopsis sp. NPDC059235 TaxID=3346782 RepID=UPI003671D713
MDLDEDAVPARGLRRYVDAVGAAVGAGPDLVVWLLDAPATAYVPLYGRLPVFPELDLALVWDEQAGWAVAVEADSGFDLVEVSYLGGDVLPVPAAVARFVRALTAGGRPGRPDRPVLREVGDPGLDRRLAAWPPAGAASPEPGTPGGEAAAAA